MAQRIQNVRDLTASKAAKVRGSQNHRDGYRPLTTQKLNDGSYKITWDNTPGPSPIPPRTMTQRAYVVEIAARDNVIIT